jgi:hypothetical protein
MTRQHGLTTACALALLASAICTAQPTKPSDDAWPLYAQAAARITEGNKLGICSPAASNLEYNDFPPFPPEWHRMMKATWDYNASAREIVHQARSIESARWPATMKEGKIEVKYLSLCRNIANEVADAALYQHLQGNDADAVESLRDLLHMADLMDKDPEELAVQSLVAVGIRAISMHRLNVIAADMNLTADPTDHKLLQIDAVRSLIRQLFSTEDPLISFDVVLKREAVFAKRENYPEMEKESLERLKTTVRRGQMESNLSAMSLACHLYRFEKSRWPASIADLVSYLPAAPTDTWGAMGYVLIKADRLNGADRPLVYSRHQSKDGLFYRVDDPQFGYYSGDGSDLSRNPPKQGGQFRDVTLWAPAKQKPVPTTQPLR